MGCVLRVSRERIWYSGGARGMYTACTGASWGARGGYGSRVCLGQPGGSLQAAPHHRAPQGGQLRRIGTGRDLEAHAVPEHVADPVVRAVEQGPLQPHETGDGDDRVLPRDLRERGERQRGGCVREGQRVQGAVLRAVGGAEPQGHGVVEAPEVHEASVARAQQQRP